jgi:hypothetical protein
MKLNYQARWATPKRVHTLRRSGELRSGVLLDSLRGYIVVEPAGVRLGDGKPLSRNEADFELNEAWCRDAHRTVVEARKRLGLQVGSPE